MILCGLSAGSLCWFAEAVSGYHGEVNRVPALGFLRHSNAVHYCDGDRRGAFHRHLLDGMPAGFAAEDGAALRFVGDELVEVVSSRPEARAYKLERRGSRCSRRGWPPATWARRPRTTSFRWCARPRPRLRW